MKQLSVIIRGGGGRGTTYSKYMAQMPQHYRSVGIAEPDPARREKLRSAYDVPLCDCCSSWEEMLERPKMADIAMITTSDDMHFQPALKAIDKGYHLLL